MFKYFVFAIILGAVASEPVKRSMYHHSNFDNNAIVHAPEFEMQDIGDVISNTFDLSIKPNGINVVVDLVSALMQYKATALSIATQIIEWAMSNIMFIGIGAISIIGLCKLTGSTIYEYVPVNQIQSLATPHVIDQAEKLLFTAIEKYAEKKKRDV